MEPKPFQNAFRFFLFLCSTYFFPLAVSSKTELSTCWQLAGSQLSNVKWSFFVCQ